MLGEVFWGAEQQREEEKGGGDGGQVPQKAACGCSYSLCVPLQTHIVVVACNSPLCLVVFVHSQAACLRPLCVLHCMKPPSC